MWQRMVHLILWIDTFVTHLTSIPIVQNSDNEPYSRSWLTVFLFSGYSAVMIMALMATVSIEVKPDFGGTRQTIVF